MINETRVMTERNEAVVLTEETAKIIPLETGSGEELARSPDRFINR